MADLTQTPANVRVSSTARTSRVTAGATITPGQPVYLTTDGDYELADADALASAAVKGISASYADDGDDLLIVTEGDMDLGATLAVGTIYVVSNTAGNIMPSTDLTTDQFTTILGIATATGTLAVNLNAGGVAVP